MSESGKHNQDISKMYWELVKASIILPGTVLVFVPSAIVLLSRNTRFAAELATYTQILFWLGLLAAGIGITLSSWTVTLFMRFGQGTPAPWEPPRKFVVRGPYRYVRNPMISGVLLILFSESIFLQSWPIAVWMVVFFTANAIYFPLVEEKELEKRFGGEYLNYKANVSRWIPRLKPWKPTKQVSC